MSLSIDSFLSQFLASVICSAKSTHSESNTARWFWAEWKRHIQCHLIEIRVSDLHVHVSKHSKPSSLVCANKTESEREHNKNNNNDTHPHKHPLSAHSIIRKKRSLYPHTHTVHQLSRALPTSVRLGYSWMSGLPMESHIPLHRITTNATNYRILCHSIALVVSCDGIRVFM